MAVSLKVSWMVSPAVHAGAVSSTNTVITCPLPGAIRAAPVEINTQTMVLPVCSQSQLSPLLREVVVQTGAALSVTWSGVSVSVNCTARTATSLVSEIGIATRCWPGAVVALPTSKVAFGWLHPLTIRRLSKLPRNVSFLPYASISSLNSTMGFAGSTK